LIERVYLKDCIGFDEVELEFKKGLVVFTGPSGAGKSVLMGLILSLFGIKEFEAKVGEILLNMDIDFEKFGLEKDDAIIVRGVKKEKIRFFINSQTVSKKILREIFKDKVGYLSQKESSIFKSQNIIEALDQISSKMFEGFGKILKSYKDKFLEYKKYQKELNRLIEDEKKINDLIEFAKFEIKKIEDIDPKIGEYEELIKIKKELSKREKIEEAINKAFLIFDYEDLVIDALNKIEADTSFFDDAMNRLREIFEKEKDRLLELEDIDIEEVLDRIEKLSELKRRYGSIQEAIEYLNQKKDELKKYENLTFEKSDLEKKVLKLKDELKNLAKKISDFRKKSSIIFEKEINNFLKDLKLPDISFEHSLKELQNSGIDEFNIKLKGVGFHKISSGEFNRLRLAFLAALSKYKKADEQILILDEIDANVSGEESIAVANILKTLSKNYQIFAISHQAQLSSVANQHFLVYKKENKSFVKELDENERVKEIARIISGEKITKEAKDFAKGILSRNVG